MAAIGMTLTIQHTNCTIHLDHGVINQSMSRQLFSNLVACCQTWWLVVQYSLEVGVWYLVEIWSIVMAEHWTCSLTKRINLNAFC